jgi:hypothetical protein
VYNFGDSVFKELISCLSLNESSFEISSYCAQKCGDTAERLEVYISDVNVLLKLFALSSPSDLQSSEEHPRSCEGFFLYL